MFKRLALIVIGVMAALLAAEGLHRLLRSGPPAPAVVEAELERLLNPTGQFLAPTERWSG